MIGTEKSDYGIQMKNNRFYVLLVVIVVVQSLSATASPNAEYNRGANAQIVLAAPDLFSAQAVSSNRIDLRWRDNSANEQGFSIRWGTSPDSPPNEILVEKNTTTYSHTALSPDTTYYYKINARHRLGNSSYSLTVTDTTLCSPGMERIIVDDATNGGPLKLGYSEKGTDWGNSGSDTQYNGGSRVTLNEGDSAIWKADLAGGEYEVYIRWTSREKFNRDRCANYYFFDSSGERLTHKVVNQNDMSKVGKWNLLGTYVIKTGTARVELHRTKTRGATSADAAKWLRIGDGGVPQAPIVQILAPDYGARFVEGENITIRAAAFDGDGSVTRVEFYRDTVKLEQDTASPYTYIWKNAPIGTYLLTVRAYDNVGTVRVSLPVKIAVQSASQQEVIIVDNGFTPKDQGQFVKTGAWSGSECSDGYAGGSEAINIEGAKAEWRGYVTGGTYQISAWWSAIKKDGDIHNRSKNTRFRIYDSDGTLLRTVTVDQRASHGSWYPLGRYVIAPGTAKVAICYHSDTNGYMVADAVRWMRVDAGVPPL